MPNMSQWERTIRCEDLAGRERALKLFLAEDGMRAVLQAPAGESAVLDLTAINGLQTALSQFAVEVFRQQGGQS